MGMLMHRHLVEQEKPLPFTEPNEPVGTEESVDERPAVPEKKPVRRTPRKRSSK